MSSIPVSSKSAMLRVANVAPDVAADSRDLSVGDADRPADSLAAGDDVCVPGGGALIEGENPAVEVFGQDAADHHRQLPLAVTLGQPRDAVPQLGGSDCGRGHLGDVKRVKPGEHSGVRRPAGQLRDDVGVKDDHRSNSAARGSSALRSGSSRSPSSPWKRARMRLPRPCSAGTERQPLLEDRPDLGFHGPAVPCGLDAQPRMRDRIKPPDRKRRHRAPSMSDLTAMLAVLLMQS